MGLDVADPLERNRLEALGGLPVMDTPAEERFDRITRVAREIFGVHHAALSLLDHSRLFTKSPQGPDYPDPPREETICDAAIQTPEILVVPDVSADSRFADLPGVAGEDGVRFYARAAPECRVGKQGWRLCV